MNDKLKIVEYFKNDISDIEKAIAKNLYPCSVFCKEVASHSLFSGGKRFRPFLFILASRICGRNDNEIKNLSVVFEYLHTATLIHDDLIDEAELRRGKDAAHLKYGNAKAVLAGDFLFAKGMSLVSSTNKIELVQLISKVVENMTQGEIEQLINKKKVNLTIDEYLGIISQKTAFLIEAACIGGAIFADASDEKKQALGNYGFNLGMAFQVADDILDYSGILKDTGKKNSADLKEGKMTLPLIYALLKASKEDKDFILNLISKGNLSEDQIKEVYYLIEKYEGFKFSIEEAKKYINLACESLQVFDSSKEKEIMMVLANYILTRKS